MVSAILQEAVVPKAVDVIEQKAQVVTEAPEESKELAPQAGEEGKDTQAAKEKVEDMSSQSDSVGESQQYPGQDDADDDFECPKTPEEDAGAAPVTRRAMTRAHRKRTNAELSGPMEDDEAPPPQKKKKKSA
eukprot:CAMPEP_0114617704 /NCGR_PEP_ID=MMETSP0168-20121206/7332_1 /TAXON_ID=95228 ORGANISM="Vannella sp., Strain DIVA3 517/6/12" /NCGR_SAMPLE_ID=MMETSP0168 /ASSEMBLY_ACC=CAM_ASM_000044 /LENGTH=131 /DNA_ID=CAMNT_0001828843 /DNA_START=34 /DNA_END=429 /DNA_ORIENTATION=+